MDKEYKEIKEDYIRIASSTRSKLTVLSATVIAAIYFFLTKDNAVILKLAFLFYVGTILSEIIAGFLASQHYSLWFDKKIKTIDFRESSWGKWAERFFWIPVAFFIIGTILFVIGIF